MRKIVLSALPLLLFSASPVLSAFDHPSLLINKAEITAVKAKLGQSPWSGAWSKVKSTADAGLSKSGWNIKDTKDHLHAGGGGYSSDDYWVDRNMMDDFSYHLISMGYARHFTGDAKYSDKAAQFIDRFFFNTATYMKPVYRGDNMGTGGIFKILYGVDLHFEFLGAERQGKLKKWAADYAKSLLSKIEFGGIGGNHNRADTWVVCLMATAAVSEDAALMAKASEHFKKRSIKTSGELSGIGGGGGSEKYVMYSFVAYKEVVLVAEIARHHGIDLYSFDVQGGRSKFERFADFYANWAYNSGAHPAGKTKPGSGETDDVDMFEIIHSWKQKSSYKRVVDKVRPAFYKGSNCGPMTLTHAFGAYDIHKIWSSSGSGGTTALVVQPAASETARARLGVSLGFPDGILGEASDLRGRRIRGVSAHGAVLSIHTR